MQKVEYILLERVWKSVQCVNCVKRVSKKSSKQLKIVYKEYSNYVTHFLTQSLHLSYSFETIDIVYQRLRQFFSSEFTCIYDLVLRKCYKGKAKEGELNRQIFGQT